ncbi:MAG: carboxypeptidase regulatory-like domain-containing protein [Planctomycetaceae bacterium]|nr:MAG: carboxypeptidase regulatory-like domain-containing protein [Planctomycetaceae bacterium]
MTLAAGLLIGWTGCGSRTDPDRPRTVPASVTVLYLGQPVQGATVTFHPDDSQQRGSTARTDASGRADMWTFDPGDGVMPGSYSVTVSKMTAVVMPDPDSMSPEEYERLAQKMEAQAPAHEVPERYSRVATSGLVAEVTDGEDNQFTFELQN